MMRRSVIFVITMLVLTGCVPDEKEVSTSEETVLMKQKNHISEIKSGDWSPGLTEEEKETLFMIADDTLKWCVAGSSGSFSFDKYDITENLKVNMATFVTLKTGGSLRGCIGSLAPVAQLYRSVHDNAINASMRDHRFRPVSQQELDAIDVHISMLSPIESIESLDEFKIGEHGIILEKGMYRAVYLPEVALEQRWNKDQTLSSLSQKAGMNSNGWREGSNFKVFSSVVLEKDVLEKE